MVFQFGDIRFSITNAPNSFSVKESMKFVQIDRISNKPIVQEVGMTLITIDMSIQLHYQFVDVPLAIQSLRTTMLSSKEEELIDGAGHSYGVFKIEQMDQDIQKTDSKGRAILAEIRLSLLEHAPYDQVSKESYNAKKAAFASISVNPITVTPKKLYVTPNALAADKIISTTTLGKASLENVRKAAANPSLSYKYMQTAIRQMQKAKDAVTTAKTEANKIVFGVSNIIVLKNTIQNTADKIDTILPQLVGASDSDIPGLVSGSVTNLDTQFSTLTNSATILSAFTAVRR